MNEWMLTVIVVALIMACLTGFVIWSRRETVVRAVSILLLVAGLPLAGVLALRPLSHPAPQWLWTRGGFVTLPKETRVLAFKLKPDAAIYLWVEVPGEDAPRYIAMPWSRSKAEKLVEMRADPNQRGHMFMTRQGVFKSHPPPQPPRSLKRPQVAPNFNPEE